MDDDYNYDDDYDYKKLFLRPRAKLCSQSKMTHESFFRKYFQLIALSGVHVLTAHRYGKHVINWGGKYRKFRPDQKNLK